MLYQMGSAKIGVKVKRLFMHMAERQGHAWLEKVDLGRVNLGKGKRMIIPHGAFDPKYQITVPKCWMKG